MAFAHMAWEHFNFVSSRLTPKGAATQTKPSGLSRYKSEMLPMAFAHMAFAHMVFAHCPKTNIRSAIQ